MPLPKEKNRLAMLVTIILLILLINSIRSVFDLKKSVNKLEEIKTKIAKLKEKNNKLKEDIAYVQTDEYIEKEALEKLNLTKPGYTILIIDEKKLEDTSPNIRREVPKQPNWQLWLAEFGLN